MASANGCEPLRSPSKTQSSSSYQPVHEQSVSRKNTLSGLNRTMLYLALLLALFFAPPIALVAWWNRSFRHNDLAFWRSAPIGGQFSQFGAKTIDFVSGAIIAPLIMALFNLIWFKFARVVVRNEVPGTQRSVPLVSLLEMSVTSGGTYDPWKLWMLIRGNRSRLVLMAVLGLSSAISTSLFVNVIAYEAIQVEQPFAPGANWSLSRLPSLEIADQGLSSWIPHEKDWSRADSNVTIEATSILHRISYDELTNTTGQCWLPIGEYVAVNTSRLSLDSVPSTVGQLWDIPAIRLGLECAPVNLSAASVDPIDPFSNSGAIFVSATLPDRDGNFSFANSYTGSIGQFINAPFNYYTVMWEYQNSPKTNYTRYTRFALLVIESGSQLNHTLPDTLPAIPSAFGNIQPGIMWYEDQLTEMDILKLQNATLTWYGVACQLQRTQGSVNLTRAVSRIQDWDVSSMSFAKSSESSYGMLHVLDKLKFPYQSPVGYSSGMGSALGTPTAYSVNGTTAVNMTAYAHNFLYASGMIESSILNSAVSNKTLVPNQETYQVAGVHTVLKYRMTYVPGILAMGLITLTICSAIVLGMTLRSWGSISTKTGRLVDGLRFVVDFAEAVRQDESLVDASEWTRDELSSWASSVKLRYELAKDKDGKEECIKLLKED